MGASSTKGRDARELLDLRFLAAGGCQDFAHLLLGVLRKRGIPARYVSGYLVPQNKDNPAAKLEEVIGGQASHAWAEAYIPDADWTPLDPRLGKPVGMRHGRDYSNVAPVRGVYKGHASQSSRSMLVCVLRSTTRDTRRCRNRPPFR